MLKFIRTQIWLWPLLFAVLLTVVVVYAVQTLESTMREHVRSQLQTTLHTAVAALEIWADENQDVLDVVAAEPRLVAATQQLIRLSRESGESAQALTDSPAQAKIRALVTETVTRHGYEGWGVMTRSGFMLANLHDLFIGRRPRAAGALSQVFENQTIVTPPIHWDSMGDNDQSSETMIVAGPIRDTEGNIIAALGFSFDPELEFSRILNEARPGLSGETYAFNSEGMMVSRSRFEDQLRNIGMLPEDEEVSSALHIQIRDPGGRIAQGHEPNLAVRARPFTKMAAEAISGRPGSDVIGYLDYRGVAVVGAWTWVDSLKIGVTTEMDVDEAYAGLYSVQRTLMALVAVLIIGAAGMFLYSFLVIRLRSQVKEANQLGRYRIERKLGKGGMGTVYLAKHALLRRPTAIKVLDGEHSDPKAVARFEREVQVSSSLSHPNTIEIYDYGYTPQGTFYYAMELLRGITLGRCVDEDGAQCDARVVDIMKQSCASLAEAHRNGLIHRDLKPSNIMLCELGGLLDFVKVLDFGLVKQEQQSEDIALTNVNTLTGTPLYMSPEAVETPETMDARSDVYQLGCIAYYLVTGTHLFEGTSPVEVLAQHIGQQPDRPSTRVGTPISSDLEELIMRCLSKSPDNRPRDAGIMLEMLEECRYEKNWTQSDAEAWWQIWFEKHESAAEHESPDSGSLPSNWEIEMKGRNT